MNIDCRRATKPLPHSSFGQIGYAPTTSAGMVNSMGLGIEKPKHDLGWPSLGPLFRDMEPARA